MLPDRDSQLSGGGNCRNLFAFLCLYTLEEGAQRSRRGLY
jgi:hypothetical protein